MDLSTLDPAALVNSVAHETRFAVGSAAEFNARWRAALRERFEAQGVADELDAWLNTGLSNGRPLKLEVMAIKPNVWFSVERISVGEMPREIPYAQAWFKVHAHPNLEFEQTLVGALCASSAESPPRHRRAPSSRHRRDATQARGAALRRPADASRRRRGPRPAARAGLGGRHRARGGLRRQRRRERPPELHEK